MLKQISNFKFYFYSKWYWQLNVSLFLLFIKYICILKRYYEINTSEYKFLSNRNIPLYFQSYSVRDKHLNSYILYKRKSHHVIIYVEFLNYCIILSTFIKFLDNMHYLKNRIMSFIASINWFEYKIQTVQTLIYWHIIGCVLFRYFMWNSSHFIIKSLIRIIKVSNQSPTILLSHTANSIKVLYSRIHL